MRLVEEEDELRPVAVADLGQALEQLGQEPQQEGGVEPGRAHQPVGRQHVDGAAAVRGALEEVVDLQRGLAEEVLPALVLQHQELALDRPHRGGRDVAVFRRELGGVLRHVAEQGAQVLEVEQQQALLVRHPEQDVQHARLGVVELQQPRHQQRPHLGDGRPDGRALLAEQVPEHRREGLRRVGYADRAGPVEEGRPPVAGHRQPREVALHVGREDRHAGAAEALREGLQRHGLAGARGARDEAVSVAHRQRQRDVASGPAVARVGEAERDRAGRAGRV